MKITFVAFCLSLSLLSLLASAQRIPVLNYVDTGAERKPDETIIYGSFISKPGIWYNDYLQYIRVQNTDTKEIFSIEVQPQLVTERESFFCFYIKPGNYVVLRYFFWESKMYSDRGAAKLVYKNVDYNIDLKRKIDSGLVKTDTLKQFAFKVPGPGLYYLGKWNFDTGIVSFTDDKATLDEIMPMEFSQLKFDSALTAIPD